MNWPYISVFRKKTLKQLLQYKTRFLYVQHHGSGHQTVHVRKQVNLKKKFQGKVVNSALLFTIHTNPLISAPKWTRRITNKLFVDLE